MTTLGLDTAAPLALTEPQPTRAVSLGSGSAATVSTRAEWTCDNCATPNAARRRCRDCGTSRY